MVKRLTMVMGGLILGTGMALAQTAVTGKVVSQEDGEPVIGASIKIAAPRRVRLLTLTVTLHFQLQVKMQYLKYLTWVCRLKK